jgi:hypothetical protein
VYADTLRSAAWLDVGAEPIVLSVPETHGRFYVLSLVDLWTNVFAVVGARATGTEAGEYAITGPHSGARTLPPGIQNVPAPTRMVHLFGLTQVDGQAGYPAAHAIQDGYGLSALHPGGARHELVAPPTGRTPPVSQVERMDARTFFGELCRLMRDNPPRLEDRPMVGRMRKLGLLEGDLGWHRLPVDIRRAVQRGAQRGLERVTAAAEAPPGEPVGDWRVRFRLGQFGTDYLSRAAAACAGLEPGPAADELPALLATDADGDPLTGRRRYVLRFGPQALPPVHGFWTLSTYDGRQAMVDNPVERYSIGDWNGLALDADGSLPICIQHQRPDPDERSNWLPAPPGRFNLLLRLCWPQAEVLDRKWTPPPLVRVDPGVMPGSCDPGDGTAPAAA